MKKRLVSILLIFLICISMFTGCSKELKTSEYSEVLKSAFTYVFDKNDIEIILDVSKFNKNDISNFIEFAKERLNEKSTLITQSDDENIKKEPEEYYDSNNHHHIIPYCSFGFNDNYENTADQATVFVLLIYGSDDGYGKVLKLEKNNNVWEVVNSEEHYLMS